MVILVELKEFPQSKISPSGKLGSLGLTTLYTETVTGNSHAFQLRINFKLKAATAWHASWRSFCHGCMRLASQ